MHSSRGKVIIDLLRGMDQRERWHALLMVALRSGKPKHMRYANSGPCLCGCGRQAETRGRHSSCYATLMREIRRGDVREEDEIAAGRLRPKQRGKLPLEISRGLRANRG